MFDGIHNRFLQCQMNISDFFIKKLTDLSYDIDKSVHNLFCKAKVRRQFALHRPIRILH